MIFLLLFNAVFAKPFQVLIDPADIDEYDDLLEQAAGLSPSDATHVELVYEDEQGTIRSAEELLPVLPSVPQKEQYEIKPMSLGVDLPGSSAGSLTQKAVYLSQSHGLYWSDYHGTFYTQRGVYYGAVEDFFNTEGMNQYLIRYLENAGGSVFTV